MQRRRQSLSEILDSLTRIQADWRDPLADDVLRRLSEVPEKEEYTRSDVQTFLESHAPKANFSASDAFRSGLTAVRLFLDLSRDEFEAALRAILGEGGTGINRYRKDGTAFLAALESLGILQSMTDVVQRPLTWQALLEERLKSGRGSAIKGQQRGRTIEDFAEGCLIEVFGAGNYDSRCRFKGASGRRDEKCDFAIPSKDDAEILIEAKGYGATGSKQSDVLGDITRIVAEKRHDTTFLLVTDGIMWRPRQSDLRKIVRMQNRGEIDRIYTRNMRDGLVEDLATLRKEKGIQPRKSV